MKVRADAKTIDRGRTARGEATAGQMVDRFPIHRRSLRRPPRPRLFRPLAARPRHRRRPRPDPFHADVAGGDRYLILREAQRARTLEALILLATQPR